MALGAILRDRGVTGPRQLVGVASPVTMFAVVRAFLEVHGDGANVLIGRVAQAVVHDSAIGPKATPIGRSAPVAQEGLDSATLVADAGGSGIEDDVGRQPLLYRRRRQAPLRLGRRPEVARRVACTAMARALGQIGAAVPVGRMFRVGR